MIGDLDIPVVVRQWYYVWCGDHYSGEKQYGEHGEFTSNRTAEQELSMLSLHLLQISLVYINTLLIQNILSEPAWRQRMTEEDWRGLTPLIYQHVNPYGRIELDMDQRLALAA